MTNQNFDFFFSAFLLLVSLFFVYLARRSYKKGVAIGISPLDTTLGISDNPIRTIDKSSHPKIFLFAIISYSFGALVFISFAIFAAVYGYINYGNFK